MSGELYGLLGLLVVLVMILIRVPVGAALGITGLLGYTAMDGWNNAGLAAGQTSSYLVGEGAYGLTVVPLFI